MKALLVKIRADIGGRPGQTGVILLLTLLASAMAVGSLTTLTKASDSYDEAAQRLSGPHLLFTWDAARVSPGEIAATSHLPGITAVGQVHPVVFLPFEREKSKAKFTLEVAGRDSADEAVDRYQLVAGRWPERPGEIAVTWLGRPDTDWMDASIGERITALSRADKPSFVVVGRVMGMTQEANHGFRAFVRSDQVAPLTDQDAYRMGYELAYRVQHPETDASLASYAAAIRAALPPGSESAPVMTSLADRRMQAWMSSFAGPGVLFALFALGCAVVIIGTVVTGSILANQRELGIMQAVGFSRRQVIAVVAGGAMAPALAGAALGIPVGFVASQPTISSGAQNLVVPPPLAISPVLDLAVLSFIVLVVAIAAVVAARHAGSGDPARVIARSSAPTVSTDGFLARTLRSLPLPRAVRLGVGDTFLRPLRSVVTIAVLVIGIATMTLAAGLGSLVGALTENKATVAANYALTVDRFGPLSDDRALAILHADPDVSAALGVRETGMLIDGSSEPVPATAMRGDPAGLDYRASAGRWFDGPGEAVVSGSVMRELGIDIGDLVTGSVDGRPIRLRIVGEFDDFTSYDSRHIRFDWATYQAAFPGAAPREYFVGLRAGSNPNKAALRLDRAEPDFLHAAINMKVIEQARLGPLFSSYIGLPTLLLLLIGAIAVFNTILLNTTERGFDHAVLKAIGMSPTQVTAMAASPAVGLGLLAIIVGLPLGVVLYRWLVGVMAQAAHDTGGPMFARGIDLPVFALVAGLAMVFAIAGAWLPARWAADRPVVDALRAE